MNCNSLFSPFLLYSTNNDVCDVKKTSGSVGKSSYDGTWAYDKEKVRYESIPDNPSRPRK